jgi:hypothetical protein
MNDFCQQQMGVPDSFSLHSTPRRHFAYQTLIQLQALARKTGMAMA